MSLARILLRVPRDDRLVILKAIDARGQTACALKASLDVANARIAELEREVAIDNQLLASYDHLLSMFDCPAHGKCVPFAMDEIKRLRSLEGSTKQP